MRSVFRPLVKNTKLVFTPAPEPVNAPPGKLRMHHRSCSSKSFRLVLTKASSFVRYSNPSSSTMPQRPPGSRICITYCTNSTCVARVLKGKGPCASLPSLPPKGGLVRTTWKRSGAPSHNPPYTVCFDSVLPCHRGGSSPPCHPQI